MRGCHHNAADDVIEARAQPATSKDPDGGYRRFKEDMTTGACKLHRGKGTVVLNRSPNLGQVMTHEDSIRILHEGDRTPLLIPVRNERGFDI
jgi:hypothetical protein